MQRYPPGDPRNTGALGTIGRERGTQEAAVMQAAQKQNFGQPLVPELATIRQPYARELATNPGLQERLFRIMVNEQRKHPQGVQGIVENAMNRAYLRGTTLAKQLKWHRHEPNGYYQVGPAGTQSNEYKRYLTTLNQAVQNALGGGNITDFATDNASGSLARHQRASGAFRFRTTYGGETFFAPGTAEPGLARKWDRWVAGMQAPQTIQAGR